MSLLFRLKFPTLKYKLKSANWRTSDDPDVPTGEFFSIGNKPRIIFRDLPYPWYLLFFFPGQDQQ